MTIQFDRRGLILGSGAAAFAMPAFAQREPPPPPPAAPMPMVRGLPAAPPPSVDVASDIDGRIDKFIKRQIDTNRLTGAVTAVARRNKLVHFQAHGLFDREAGTKMPTDALMVMMSSTKPVCGVALLQQIEEGKVSLDDKISKFIPELKTLQVRKAGAPRPARGQVDPASNLEPQAREITIKDLATHTSGLNTAPTRPDGVPNTLEAVIPLCKNVVLDFQPGTRWAYSASIGPDILARVVEITSGVPFDRYIKERIFEPCGMIDTGHNLTDAQRARVVPRYERTNNAWVRARTAPGNPKTTYMAGGFGLQSTAHDYLMFETMLLNEGTIHGKRVLKPRTVRLMRSNLVGDLYKGIGGTTEGTGFGVQVRTVLDPDLCGCGRDVGGFGWGGAYGTMTWSDPRNDLVGVYFVQQPHDDLRQEFEYVVKSTLGYQRR